MILTRGIMQIKGQEDLKGSMDGTFKSMSEELKKNVCQEDIREMSSVISTLPGKFESFTVKLQNDLSKSLIKEIQATILIKLDIYTYEYLRHIVLHS